MRRQKCVLAGDCLRLRATAQRSQPNRPSLGGGDGIARALRNFWRPSRAATRLRVISLRRVIVFGSSRRAGRTSQFQISLSWTLSNGWPAKLGSFDGAHAGTARLHPARAGAGAQHHLDHCAGIIAAFETYPTLTPESWLTKPNPLVTVGWGFSISAFTRNRFKLAVNLGSVHRFAAQPQPPVRQHVVGHGVF